MELIEGRTIEGEVVSIDEKRFVDCVLIGCVLQYRGLPVSFTRTRMRDCRYVFFERARSTVHFLHDIGLLPKLPHDWAEFSETVN